MNVLWLIHLTVMLDHHRYLIELSYFWLFWLIHLTVMLDHHHCLIKFCIQHHPNLLLVVLVDPSDRDVLPQLLHLLLLLLKICLQLGVSTLGCLKEGEEKTGWKKSTNEVLLKSKWRLVMRLIWYYETSFSSPSVVSPRSVSWQQLWSLQPLSPEYGIEHDYHFPSCFLNYCLPISLFWDVHCSVTSLSTRWTLSSAWPAASPTC